MLIDLETEVIRALDFDFQWVSPLIFLERFIRLYDLDREENDEMKSTVEGAKEFLQFYKADS